MKKQTVCTHCKAVNSHYSFQCHTQRKPISKITHKSSVGKVPLIEQAAEHLESIRESQVKIRSAIEKASKKEKSLPELLKLAEIVFNKWIRNRDKGNHGSFVCICCRKSHLNENMDAGHMFPKTYSALRFHEDNLWGQYNGCNRLEYGNVEEFKRNVKIIIGEERFNALEELKHVVKKWDKEELLEIIKKYKL